MGSGTRGPLALQRGINSRVVQERLGHKSIAITLGTYSHVLPAMQTGAADQIADLISSAT